MMGLGVVDRILFLIPSHLQGVVAEELPMIGPAGLVALVVVALEGLRVLGGQAHRVTMVELALAVSLI